MLREQMRDTHRYLVSGCGRQKATVAWAAAEWAALRSVQMRANSLALAVISGTAITYDISKPPIGPQCVPFL